MYKRQGAQYAKAFVWFIQVHLRQQGRLHSWYDKTDGVKYGGSYKFRKCTVLSLIHICSPAAIGLVMADLAIKSSPVEIIRYMTPDIGTSHSNEVIVAVTGEASAVKNAVLTARDIGLQLLVSMGSYPETPTQPYL